MSTKFEFEHCLTHTDIIVQKNVDTLFEKLRRHFKHVKSASTKVLLLTITKK